MKIALYSSKRPRCGISTYTDHLARALAELGHDVRYYQAKAPFEEGFREIHAWKPDIFHFQHEPSIMPPDELSAKFARELRDRKASVFLTLHTENRQTVKSGIQICPNWRAIVLHRPSLMIEATVIPMPCPVAPAPKGIERMALRQKYGFDPRSTILSTTGFLIPWKDHAEVIRQLLPWLKQRSEVVLQVVAAPHFNPDVAPYAQQATAAIAGFAKEIGKNRIQHIASYPSDEELLERLILSDLGYVWCPMHTGSMSAAGALFTSARVGLVATDSTHYLYLGDGTVHASKTSMGAFAKMIQDTAGSKEQLAKLSQLQEQVYQERNYLITAKKHLELYEREKV